MKTNANAIIIAIAVIIAGDLPTKLSAHFVQDFAQSLSHGFAPFVRQQSLQTCAVQQSVNGRQVA